MPAADGEAVDGRDDRLGHVPDDPVQQSISNNPLSDGP